MVPDVEEAQASDVGRVSVVDEARQLPPGQFEGEELVEETKCCGHNPPSCHAPYLQEIEQSMRNRCTQ